jgi:hypothetical protein
MPSPDPSSILNFLQTVFEWEKNGLADTASTLLLILLGHNMLLYCIASIVAGAFDVTFTGACMIPVRLTNVARVCY